MVINIQERPLGGVKEAVAPHGILNCLFFNINIIIINIGL